jgi:hypothetical protein
MDNTDSEQYHHFIGPEVWARLKVVTRLVLNQLGAADLNLHEGRLRSSIMPSKYMYIPDDISELN